MICNFQLKFISKHVYKLKTTEKTKTNKTILKCNQSNHI